uniref:DNA polymerase, beta domain protein region n=1 Tax=Leptospirillum ferrodiazotrophum TaxID=412449 RepID=C6I095_9BACT|nr:MAG: DNA polymerase, beta domain protein region [Leptospirillum ferrodiazotrophum]
MSLDVRPDHLKIVQDILSAHVPDREVWAFGSRVTGKATETSDLDLTIIGETPLDFETLAALRDAFSESRLPYKVDVVDWATISETFREIILKEKVVVQKMWKKLGSGMEWQKIPFERVLLGPIRNGIYKPSNFHGRGTKIINMGELFKYPRMYSVPMKRVDLSLSEGDRSNILKGDLIFARRSLVPAGAGKCSIVLEVQEPTTFESSIIRVRPDQTKSHSLFLFYYFNSPVGLHSLDTIRRQVAVSGITGKDLARLEVPNPPLSEQRAIAHILGTLDDKIELNRRMNETLEAMAQAIFKSWFVDFDPVRAKMEGRETGLPKEIEDLFPDSFEDSELGEIPRGWRVRSTGEAFELNPSEKLSKGKNSPYLDMSAIPTQGSWPESPIYRPFVSGSKFRNGDTLFARITPCLENGKTAYIQCLEEEQVGWGSTEFIVIRPKAPFPKEFGYLLARDNAFREHAIQSMSGTSGRQRVQLDSIAAFKILQPEARILKAFEVIIRQWFELIKVNSEFIAGFNQMRDALLPKLLTGEIRVSGPEKFLESANVK